MSSRRGVEKMQEIAAAGARLHPYLAVYWKAYTFMYKQPHLIVSRGLILNQSAVTRGRLFLWTGVAAHSVYRVKGAPIITAQLDRITLVFSANTNRVVQSTNQLNKSLCPSTSVLHDHIKKAKLRG